MPKLTATFITMFKQPVASWLDSSIIARAQEQGVLKCYVESVLESLAFDHHAADDTPYGGGPGELMKIDVIAPLIHQVLGRNQKLHRDKKRVLLMDPGGLPFSQAHAKRLLHFDELIFVCGRYEGIDARIHHYVDEAISIGDYVLSSGDLAAMVIFDSVARMTEGVLGNYESCRLESHSDGRLESSQYTRPSVFQGFLVPEIFQNGNHQAIAKERLKEAAYKTKSLRPDLLLQFPLTTEEMEAVTELEQAALSYPWMKLHE